VAYVSEYVRASLQNLDDARSFAETELATRRRLSGTRRMICKRPGGSLPGSVFCNVTFECDAPSSVTS